jgi:hypothetical protein
MPFLSLVRILSMVWASLYERRLSGIKRIRDCRSLLDRETPRA